MPLKNHVLCCDQDRVNSVVGVGFVGFVSIQELTLSVGVASLPREDSPITSDYS